VSNAGGPAAAQSLDARRIRGIRRGEADRALRWTRKGSAESLAAATRVPEPRRPYVPDLSCHLTWSPRGPYVPEPPRRCDLCASPQRVRSGITFECTDALHMPCANIRCIMILITSTPLRHVNTRLVCCLKMSVHIIAEYAWWMSSAIGYVWISEYCMQS
jgi:hypothetical protein